MNQTPYDEWTEKIIARINGELDAVENALFDSHVQACPQCRRELREYKLLSHRLHALERFVAAPALSPALLGLKQEIAQDTQNPLFEEVQQVLDQTPLSETKDSSLREGKKIRYPVSSAGNVKLRLARRKNSWTMKETANMVGVSLVTYGRWERGLQKPHLGTLKDLCKVFEKSTEELGFGDLSQ